MLPPVDDRAISSVFAAALLDPDAPTPEGLTGPGSGRADKRFAVYRNNVNVSLVKALGDIFPTVQRLVGEEFFRAMALIFIRRHPPTSPLLFTYGAGFADFLEGFPPVAKLPYLPDVARLERLWLDSWHSADAPVLEGQALAAIAPEDLPAIRFVPHPATRLIRSDHAVVSIIARDRSRESLSGLDPSRPESGLITRPRYDVELRHLPPGGHAFLSALIADATLGEAAGAAMEADATAELPGLIGFTLASGAFAAIRP